MLEERPSGSGRSSAGVYRIPGCVGSGSPPGSITGHVRIPAPMPTREPELPETDDRRCPYCRYQRITADGHATLAQGKIKERLRCELCGLRFVFVRKARG